MRRGACRTDADSLPVGCRLLGAFALATLLHAAVQSRSIIDSFWVAGLFVGGAALALHLSSTRWINGCLPSNVAGDVVFQFGVAGSLAMVL